MSSDKEIVDRLAHTIRTYAPRSHVTYSLRDAAVGAAFETHSAEVTEEVDRIISDLTSNRFGDTTTMLERLTSKNEQIRYAAFDLLGGMTAEIAADVAYRLFNQPEQPSEHATCIRYLSPEKWLWLLHQKSIRFSDPSTFTTDTCDSTMPNAVLEGVILELYKHGILKDVDPKWVDYAAGHWLQEQNIARSRYRVSCWNLFDEHTSHLMWYQFAGGGRSGAALLCKYGKLRNAMDVLLTQVTVRNVEWHDAGLVSYDSRQLVDPLFFKRPEYRDEREVRLVAHAIEGDEVELPLSYVIDSLKVITPPDASSHHEDAVQSTWLKLKEGIEPFHFDQ